MPTEAHPHHRKAALMNALAERSELCRTGKKAMDHQNA
jgi:hypothetical protein